MSSIDERVVEMQFDNSDFESGIKESSQSLDKFKDSLDLDGASKGLDSISNAVSQFTMDGVTTAVETSSNSFSALETVAVSALVTITSQAVQAGEQLLASLSVDQISAGYDKYTQKLSNVQTIMNSTGESVDTVNGYMDHLMWYSDETSYGFTDMTSALANMVSTGGEVESLIPMIEGVANATAYAGQNAQAFSYVMSAINSGYSRGYMQATDWARIEHQNAASKELKTTLIETAESLGKLEEGEVTLENFKSTLSTGKWLDTEVLEEGFSVFSEMTEAAYDLIEAGEYDTATEAYAALESEYGDIAVAAAEAAQQAKTFGEAIDATKDAVSSKWSDIMETLFGDYDQATQLWTDLSEELYDLLAEPIAGLGDLLSDAFSMGGGSTSEAVEGYSGSFSKISKEVEKAGLSVEDFEQAVLSAAEASGLATDIEEQFGGSIEDAFNSLDSSSKLDVLNDAFDLLCGSSDSAADSISSLGDVVNEVIRGDFGNGEERINALTEAGYDYEQVQALVNERMAEGRTDWEDLSDAELENLGYTEEEIEEWKALKDSVNGVAEATEEAGDGLSGFEAFWGGLGNIGEMLKSIGGAITAAFSDVFSGPTSDGIYNGLQTFYEKTSSILEKVQAAAEKLKGVFRGLFSVIGLGKDIVVGIAQGGFNLLQKVLGACNIDILGILSNIGNLIYSFRNWIKENKIINKVVDGFTNVITNVGKAVSAMYHNFMQLPAVQSVMSGLSKIGNSVLGWFQKAFPATSWVIQHFLETFDGFENINWDSILAAFRVFRSEVTEKLTEAFPKTSAKITEFVNKFKEDLSSLTFDDVLDLLKTFKAEFGKKINEFIEGNDSLKSIRDGLVSFFNSFKETLAGMGIDLDGIVATITNLKDKITGAIKDLLKSFGIISEDDEISESMESIGEGIDAVSGAAEQVSGPLETLSSILGSFKESATTAVSGFFDAIGKINVGKIISVAAGLTVLVGAIALVASILKISGAFTNITQSIRDMTKAFKMQSMGTSMLEIAAAIGILAASLYALAQLPTADLLTAAGVIIAVAGALTIMGKLSGKSGGLGNLGTFGGIAIALLAVIEALKMLDDIEFNAKFIGKIALIAGIIAALTAVIMLINKTPSFNNGISNAAEMVGLALSLKLIVSALQDITEMNLEPGDVLALVAIIAGLAAAMKVLNGVTGGFSSIGSAATIVAIPLALKMMVSVLDDLANYDTDKIADAIGNFIIILGMLASLAVVSRLAGKGGGTSMLAMAASVLVMAAAIALLGNLDEGAMQNGLAAVEMLSLTLGAIMAALTLVNKIPGGGISSVGSILAIAGAVAIMAAAVAALSLIDPDSLQSATTALMEIGAIFAVMEGFSAFTKFSNIGSIIALIAAIAVIAAAIAGVSMCDPEAVSNAANAIAELGLVFSAMEVLSAFTGLASVASILSLVAVIGVISLCLGLLANLTDPGDVTSIADSLSECMLAFSVALLACSVAGIAGAAALVGLGEMVAVIGVLTAVLVALSSLAGLASGTAFGDNMIEGMEFIGELFGALVGAFAGEAIKVCAEVVAGAADDINAISEAVAPIGDCVSDIANAFGNMDEGSLSNIDTFAAAILKLSAADLLESISSFITGSSDFGNLATGLTSLALSMSVFSLMAQSIDSEGLDTGLEAIDKLNTAKGSLEKVGGIAQLFTGETEWSSLSTGLEDLGSAMKTFSDDVSGVSIDESVTTSISNLAAAQSSISAVGGIADIMGDHEWSTLSDGLPEMAEALGNFSDELEKGGITAESAESMGSVVDCLSALADAQGKIDGAGGVLQDLIGDTEWSTLSSGLPTMGKALAGFSDALVGENGEPINTENVNAAITAMSALADAQSDISRTGGVLNKLFGTKSWTTLSTDLEELGKGLSSLSDVGGEIDSNAITKSVEAISAVSGLGDSVTAYSDNFEWILNNLEPLGTAICSFGEEISDVTWPDDTESMIGIITALGDATEASKGLKANGGAGHLPDVLDKMGPALKTFCNKIKDITFPDNLSELSSLISAIGEATSAAKSIKDAGVDRLGDMLSTTSEALVSFCTDMTDVTIPDLSQLTSLIKVIATAATEVADVDTTQLGTLLTSFNEAFDGFEFPDVSGDITGFIESLTSDTWPTDFSDIEACKTALQTACDGFSELEFSDASSNITDFVETLTVDSWPSEFPEIDACQTALQTACDGFSDVDYPSSVSLTEFADNLAIISWPTDFSDIEACKTALQTACDGFSELEFSDASDSISGFLESLTSDTWPTEFPEIEACKTALQTACDGFSDIDFPSAESLSGFSESLDSAFTDAGNSGAQAMLDAISSHDSDASNSGEALVSSIASGISGAESDLTGAVGTVCDAGLSEAHSREGDFYSAGSALINAMANGMRSASGAVTSAVSSICISAVNIANSYSGSLFSSGYNMMQGLANGISAGGAAVIAATQNVVSQVNALVDSMEKIGSPSKVQYEKGMFMMMGLANGVAHFGKYVAAAAKDVIEQTDAVIDDGLNSAMDLLSDSMNFSPTITPVLDLSQVKSGAATIDSLLLRTPSLSIDTDQVNRVSGSVSAYQAGQRNSGSELLSAIKDLNERFEQPRGNTYNINGVTYDDGTNVADAVQQLFHAAKMERRA